MKRHSSLITLSRDHYSGLLLAQQMKAGAAPYKGYPTDLKGKIRYLLADYEEKLKPHFAEEEGILFPFAAKGSAEMKALVDELVAEHRQLALLIEGISAAADQKDALNKIGMLLEQHIRKEERKLFELVQETFNEEQLAELENGKKSN